MQCVVKQFFEPGNRYFAIQNTELSGKRSYPLNLDMPITAEWKEPETMQSVSSQLNGQLRVLLGEVADKNKPAFEQFYDSTIKLCFSQALRITGKQDIAEEVVSDVYMQVWNRAADFDKERSGVMTWLMMISRSRALDALRKRKNQRYNETTEFDEMSEPSTDDSPQELLEATDQSKFLHGALAQLKPEQRQLLSLAYFKGMTHSEIADFTEMPLGTVKTQIRRSILILKKLLCEQEAAVISKVTRDKK